MKSFAIALSAAAVMILFAIPEIHAEEKTMNQLQLTSQAFPNNGMIPSEYTCDERTKVRRSRSGTSLQDPDLSP